MTLILCGLKHLTPSMPQSANAASRGACGTINRIDSFDMINLISTKKRPMH